MLSNVITCLDDVIRVSQVQVNPAPRESAPGWWEPLPAEDFYDTTEPPTNMALEDDARF